MIKKIHYCWFGPSMPDAVKRNVDRWRDLNPEFEICRHTEGTDDLSQSAYAQHALKEKRWAFVADVVRLMALQQEGGVYLDADVELLRPLSGLEAWSDKLVLGYMYDCALGTAVCYAPPGHPYIRDVLARYSRLPIGREVVNNCIFTEYFINEVPGFLLNGHEWENEHCKIFRKEFFEQPAFRRQAGMAIHHCCGSWKTAPSSFTCAGGAVSPLEHLLKWGSRQYRTWRAYRSNERAATWRAAHRGERRPFDASGYHDLECPADPSTPSASAGE